MGLREAIANKLRCWSFNRFACYRGTGARLRYVAPDWSVALRLRRSCVMACRAFESLISIWTRSEADSDPLLSACS